MGQITLEHQELLALEFQKIAESDFVYTLATTNLDQLVLNMGYNIYAVFPVKFQLRGFVPLTPEKWGYKEKNRGTKQN